MWDLCTNALDTAKLRGASYGDVRVMHLRQRDLTTKNGQVGTLAQSESIGLGIRVLASGAWGFASTDRLTREGVAAFAAPARFTSQNPRPGERAPPGLSPATRPLETLYGPVRQLPS